MITGLSPLDGRYQSKTKPLATYFSEFGLIRYRIVVEIKYFLSLLDQNIPQLMDFPVDKKNAVQNIATNFSIQDAEKVKEIEKTTNHDVKAVEYFIKDKFNQLNLNQFKEFIHFGLTSQDINNTAIPVSLKDALSEVVVPKLEEVLNLIDSKAESYMPIPLLSRTHGQPASPTLLGKEFLVFVKRFQRQLDQLKQLPVRGKFGGAVGNFNAHYVAYPNLDWIQFGNDFLKNQLGIERSPVTTQIDHYDNLSEHFHVISRISTILIDMCRDIWTYISRDYFKQKLVAGEIGSSTMPHKVNPIDFENAEGNLGMTVAVCNFLSNKLPISRLQRDLTDSTVLRNIGVPYGHLLIALNSLIKGLNKLEVNENTIRGDLKNNWVVVAEAIQTILRREGVDQPYELLKNLTRGEQQLDENAFVRFIEELPVSKEIKNELQLINPFNYTGKVG